MINITEIISSVLLPIPLTLVYLLFGPQSPQELEHPTITSSILVSSALSSLTLLSISTVARMRQQKDTVERRKRSHSALGPRDGNRKNNAGLLTIESGQRVLSRVLAVVLPFLAASIVGGVQAAVVGLVSATAGLSIQAPESKLSLKGWKQLLISRRWILAVIVIQILTDLLGLTSRHREVSTTATTLGYTALAISGFLLPPPYSNTSHFVPGVVSPARKPAPMKSALSIPWGISQAEALSPDGPHILSALISTPRDVNLTTLAGLISALPCGFWFLYHHEVSKLPSAVQIIYGVIVSGLSCLSFMFAKPKSLMTDKKLGLALGLLIPILLQESLVRQPWFVFASQGIFGGLLWTALTFDTHYASQTSSHITTIHHGTNHEHPTSHSGITGLLLRSTSDWPLLHSILLEKDSRRIFYFMR
jgi:zinc transporter 5/7